MKKHELHHLSSSERAELASSGKDAESISEQGCEAAAAQHTHKHAHRRRKDIRTNKQTETDHRRSSPAREAAAQAAHGLGALCASSPRQPICLKRRGASAWPKTKALSQAISARLGSRVAMCHAFMICVQCPLVVLVLSKRHAAFPICQCPRVQP